MDASATFAAECEFQPCQTSLCCQRYDYRSVWLVYGTPVITFKRASPALCRAMDLSAASGVTDSVSTLSGIVGAPGSADDVAALVAQLCGAGYRRLVCRVSGGSRHRDLISVGKTRTYDLWSAFAHSHKPTYFPVIFQ